MFGVATVIFVRLALILKALYFARRLSFVGFILLGGYLVIVYFYLNGIYRLVVLMESVLRNIE
jgi:hypothetical protein